MNRKRKSDSLREQNGQTIQSKPLPTFVSAKNYGVRPNQSIVNLAQPLQSTPKEPHSESVKDITSKTRQLASFSSPVPKARKVSSRISDNFTNKNNTPNKFDQAENNSQNESNSIHEVDVEVDLSQHFSATQRLTNSFYVPDEWETRTQDTNKLRYPLESHQMKQFLAAKGITKLYQWQERCLKLRKPIEDFKNLVYSLPTSAGKSLVAEIHLLRHLLAGKCTMMVLPFVSLVQEKVSTMNSLSHSAGVKFVVEEYAAGKGIIPPVKRRAIPALFIATIEKAGQLIASAINGKGPWIHCVVIDELHMIGEGIRGARLESLLAKLEFASTRKKQPTQIIGMSATLPNLDEVATLLNAELFTCDYRPVPLTQYLKLGPHVFKVGEKISEKNPGQKEPVTKFDRLIKNPNSQRDVDGLCPLVKENLDKHSTLIFCPTRKSCESVSKMLTENFQNIEQEDEKLLARKHLVEAINEEQLIVGGIDKDIALGLLSGVAYHHAGLSSSERVQIEDGFRRGVISVLCCTSTLAAGVNLPARRVIIRNMMQGRDKLETSTFRQMIGRAGRAGMDTEGESILIAEPKNRKAALELIGGKMQPALSQLDQMMDELILSILSLKLALTKSDLLEFIQSFTLLGLQESSKNDKVDYSEKLEDILERLEKHAAVEKIEAQSDGIHLPDEIDIRVTRIGVACVDSNNEPADAKAIWKKLDIARKSLNLENSIHLISLAIPEELIGQMRTVNFETFFDEFEKLEKDEVNAMKAIGITKVDLIRKQSGQGKLLDCHKIGFLTCLLLRYSKGVHPSKVAQMFGVDRGTVHRYWQTVITEASRLSVFTNLIDEFWFFSPFFEKLVHKLSYSQYPELAELLVIPSLPIEKAKLLYEADLTSPALIVDADEDTIRKALQGKHPISKKQITILKTNAKNIIQVELDKIREKELKLLCPERRHKQDNS